MLAGFLAGCVCYGHFTRVILTPIIKPSTYELLGFLMQLSEFNSLFLNGCNVLIRFSL